MKIAVTGKGGVGKTTVSAVLARLYAAEGKKIFAVDVDPDGISGRNAGKYCSHQQDAEVDRRKNRGR